MFGAFAGGPKFLFTPLRPYDSIRYVVVDVMRYYTM